MECKFVVGQKVVCISHWWGVLREGRGPFPPAGALPQFNQIYTVAIICADRGGVFLTLKEYSPDYEFSHTAFRPLQDRPKEADTDISVFSPALNVKKLEPVP